MQVSVTSDMTRSSDSKIDGEVTVTSTLNLARSEKRAEDFTVVCVSINQLAKRLW